MVAKKSAKAAKISYAELRKTAQENKDSLGPNWSTWVGKAINKLEEEGILATSPSAAGNLTITPTGTQAITAARKSLSVAINASPSAVPEELIWKHITQQPPTTRSQPATRGIKRGRRSTIHPVVEEEHEPLSSASSNVITTRKSKRARISIAASSPSKTRTRTKRARRSMATTVAPATPSKKSFSKMNKAELQAELRALRKGVEDDQWLRETSPLTDLGEDDSEETARLRVALQERTEEILRMRRELAAAKAAAAQQSTNEPGSPHRLPTPDIDDAPTSPLRAVASRSKGVIRTQSGSRISLVSKQPTPAPSSPGTDAADLPMAFVTDEGCDNLSMHERNDDRVQPWLQTTTPGVMTSDSLKVLQLQRDLASRVTSMNNLQAQFSQLQMDYAEAQQSVAERDTRLSQLSDKIKSLEADVALTLGDIERQSLHLEGFQNDLRSRDASLASAKAERERDRAEINRIQANLSAAEESQATLTSQVAQAENEVAALRAEMAQKKSTLDTESHRVRVGLETQLQTLLATKSELERNVGELESSKSTMAESFTKATEDHALVSRQLRDAEGANASLRSQLTSALDENSTLKATLTASDHSVAMLTSRISTMEVSQSQDTADIEKLTLSLAAAVQDMTTLRQQVTSAELSATNLQSALDVSQETTKDLRTQIAATIAERNEFASQVEAAQVTITASESSLNQLNAALATTTAELTHSVAAAAELQAKLDVTADKLVVREDQIQLLEGAASTNDQELARLVTELSMAESIARKFREETTSSDAKVKELRSQVSAAQKLLASTKANHAVESDKQASAISELEKSLQGARAEIAASKQDLHKANSVYTDIQSQLDQQSIDLGETRVNLDFARLRASKLESDLEVAIRKAQEAEEEVIELRTSKEADEATIENLKGMFLSLKETQMQSLAELDSKVVSTKSSPAPKRRSARSTSNKGPVPFKLS